MRHQKLSTKTITRSVCYECHHVTRSKIPSPIADQTRTLFVHGSALVERQVFKTSERVPRGGDYAPWSRSALISWRHSTGGRLIYGVLGRDDFSLTRDQTTICLLAGSGLNALFQSRPRGMQRGRAADPLAKMCGTTAHILQHS